MGVIDDVEVWEKDEKMKHLLVLGFMLSGYVPPAYEGRDFVRQTE